MNHLMAYMIVIKNNPTSEYYASITLPEWQRLGYDVEVFDAYTPDNLPKHFKLNFQSVTSKKYIKRNIKKYLTPTEQGCWYSHAALWLKCIQINQPIIVLEHDCYPMQPDLIKCDPKCDFVTFDDTGSGCYMITPSFCTFLWEIINSRDKVDLGPCGFIDYAKKKTNKFKVLGWGSTLRTYPCAQIHDMHRGATISHYEETDALSYVEDFGTTSRVIIKDGQQPSLEQKTKILIGK